jgi:hypothetical protein
MGNAMLGLIFLASDFSPATLCIRMTSYSPSAGPTSPATAPKVGKHDGWFSNVAVPFWLRCCRRFSAKADFDFASIAATSRTTGACAC